MTSQRRLLSISMLACIVLVSCTGHQDSFDSQQRQWQSCKQQYEKLLREGKLSDCETLLKNTVARAAKSIGQDDTSDFLLAQAQATLAEFEYRLGYKDAALLYEKLIARKEAFRGGDYLGLPWFLKALGDCYCAQGQWAQAANVYMRASSLFHSGGRLDSLASTLRGAANAYRELGEEGDGGGQAFDYVRATLLYDLALKYFYTFAQSATSELTAMGATVEIARIQHDYQKLPSLSSSRRAQLLTNEKEICLALINKIQNPQAPFVVNSIAIADKSAVTESDWQKLNIESPVMAPALVGLATSFSRVGNKFVAQSIFKQAMPGLVKLQNPNADAGQLATESLIKYQNAYDICKAEAEKNAKGKTDQEVPSSNEYLDQFMALDYPSEYFDMRPRLTHQYAWAVPNQKAIAVLKEHGPILEVGAGTGYWAYLLRKAGVNLVAYDIEPVPSHNNLWQFRADHGWTNVLAGDETCVRKYPYSTLFLCWPPGDDPFAYNALKNFQGKWFIYIGESNSGLTGSREFNELLKKDWLLDEKVDIPQWPGVYDSMYVFRRM